jgi:hypothetical protein
MDFMGFLKDVQVASMMIDDINNFWYMFDIGIEGFRWVNIWYSKITILKIKKLITMSIWPLLKNLVWTCMNFFI